MSKKNITNKGGKVILAKQIHEYSTSKSNEHASLNLVKYSTAMVDPRNAPPVIFPSIGAGRAGAAKFPLVISSLRATDTYIQVTPDVNAPLKISAESAAAEHANPISGVANYSVSDNAQFEAYDGCFEIAQLIGEKLALSLTSAGATNITVDWNMSYASMAVLVKMDAWDGSNYIGLGTIGTFGPGYASHNQKTGLVYAANYTHYRFRCQKLNSSAPGFIFTEGTFNIVPEGAGTYSCNAGNSELSMVEYHPAWDSLMAVADDVRIVAMDCLVTYEGADLYNQGSIAVCNSTTDLDIIGSAYDTVASFPFDKYRGRLASAGETEGGVHWHYIPNDARQLLLNDSDSYGSRRLPTGHIGIAGRAAGANVQPVRVEVTIHVNFYSNDPSYAMKIRPPIVGFLELLYAMRKEVPLVSSNDSHFKKILKFAQGKAKDLMKYGVDNPAEVGSMLSKMMMLL